jgi:hypothetical protein
MRTANRVMLICFVALVATQSPVLAHVKVEDSVNIDAKPEFVWKALMEYQREEKLFHKKLVSQKNDCVSIKEEFGTLPLVGSAFIDYVEVNHQKENRIDFKLTDSKVFTRFEGTWIVEPSKCGERATLTLTTDVDTWLPTPFKNKMLRNTAKRGMEKRLAFVKIHAEQLNFTEHSESQM